MYNHRTAIHNLYTRVPSTAPGKKSLSPQPAQFQTVRAAPFDVCFYRVRGTGFTRLFFTFKRHVIISLHITRGIPIYIYRLWCLYCTYNVHDPLNNLTAHIHSCYSTVCGQALWGEIQICTMWKELEGQKSSSSVVPGLDSISQLLVWESEC